MWVVIMTIFSKNMQVGHQNTIMAIEAIIIIVGNIIGNCIILVRFGEDWFKMEDVGACL
jgi:hypothetical protein